VRERGRLELLDPWRIFSRVEPVLLVGGKLRKDNVHESLWPRPPPGNSRRPARKISSRKRYVFRVTDCGLVFFTHASSLLSSGSVTYFLRDSIDGRVFPVVQNLGTCFSIQRLT
jgi:hypothetical protein